MATILWDKSIDKHVDWAGDSSTNGQPVSGKYVQEFIKDTLESKFGYIYHDQNLSKYYVFADQENFGTWYGNRVEFDNLKLAEFEAPAPATIEIVEGTKSADSVTTLLGSTGNKIAFNFLVVDKSNSIISDTLSARFTFSGANDTKTYTTNITPDSVVSDAEAGIPNYQNEKIGTHFELNIDEYLKNEGKYTITVSLSGFNSGATRTLTFFYNVIELDFTLTFDYTQPLDMAAAIYDEQFTFRSDGAGGTPKYIEIYVDDHIIYQDGIGVSNSIVRAISIDNKVDGISSNEQKRWADDLVDVDAEGHETPSPLAGQVIFSEGKHSLQARVYIAGSEIGTKFWSNTEYCEFVVEDKTNTQTDPVYLLYHTTSSAGTVIKSTDPIKIETQQYKFISLDVTGIRLKGGRIPIVYDITSLNGFTQKLEHEINNLEVDHFVNSFDTTDTYTIDIKDGINEVSQLSAVVTVEALQSYGEVVAEQCTNNLLYKYSATNRSNSETDKDVWRNSSTQFKNNERYQPKVTLNNVLFNEKSGWDGKSLVLSNGATVTFDIDLFEEFNTQLGGLTFEIDFETFNVFDDDAVIMDFSDAGENNRSYIKLTATSAETMSNGKSYLKTNFNSNSRTKIALCYNPTTEIDISGRSDGKGNPNLMLIYVDGVLDRATRWGDGSANSDKVTWDNTHTTKSFEIGDKTGKAGIKIYSIRILRQAYEPADAFMNYVVDQGADIEKIMEKNHVQDDSGNISLDLVKDKIPTLVMATDYVVMNGQGKSNSKKENTQYDLQYYDPDDRELNFYLRNGWVSRQGTSSMNYPTKNLRPYMNKNTVSQKDKDFTHDFLLTGFKINFNTEFWPYSEYKGHEDEVEKYFDNNGIPPYSVNKKQIVTGEDNEENSFHEVGAGLKDNRKKEIAKKYAENGEELWASRDSNKSFFMLKEETDGENTITIASQIDSIIDEVHSIYISAYRPIRKTGMEKGSDEYWFLLKQLRYSGVKLFTRKDTKDENGNVIKSAYKKAKALDRDTEYYGLGAYWRQWAEPATEDKASHYSGYTDKWTLKADYAESSMTHNGGIGHLWGMAMKNTTVDGNYYMMTFSQGYNSLIPSSPRVDNDFIDIRTSCDSKPVVLFVRQPESIDDDGYIVYSAPEFAGLYVIMTDKSSVELFGFKDIKDENNKYIFIADASQEDDKSKIPAGQENNKVQCFECLQNGNDLAQGLSIAFDNDDEVTFEKAEFDKKYGYNIGEDRPIFEAFEPRWPEDGSERHEWDKDDPDNAKTGDNKYWYQDDVFGTETNDFETFWNWVYFTKKAVDYKVNHGTLDGYSLSPYTKFASMQDAIDFHRRNEGLDEDSKRYIYLKYEDSGNVYYAREGTTYKDNGTDKTFEFSETAIGLELYFLEENINYEDVTKTINTKTIRQEWHPSDIFKVAVPGFDAKNRFVDAEGNLDPEDPRALKYYKEVYMWREGSKFRYEDEFGRISDYVGDIDPETDFMKDSTGRSYADRTFMDFFSATKYDHLDIYKVAAYYVYMMRFAAVDQVVKNTMTTTEDGQHWYFINYDNDTTLGVRNDAVLAYKWDITRDSYDTSINNYSYAGAKSVLWNNLSMDEDFMRIVKLVDAALNKTYLKAETVLWYLDERMCNTWCERLYNAQEQIKYLTTFKNDFQTNKFLDFVQGTRKSHRNWWVTRRWELWDAEWGTGDWGNSIMQYYQSLQASATNPIEFVRITSATRYTYEYISNTDSKYGKFVIGTDETKVLVSTFGQNGTSDPAKIYGVNKVKVLNFRPNCKDLQGAFLLAMSVKVVDENNQWVDSNWIKEKGTLMTKFLVGDGKNDVTVSSFNSLADITSIEEIDIRRCVNLQQLSLIKLSNLHRYRFGGSSLTTFEPAKGALLYEVQLPSTEQNYLSDLILDGTVFKEQLPSENVVYQKVEGYDDKYSDMLPYDLDEEGNFTAGSIYTAEKAYRYTHESKAIFDITPTYRLRNVVFKDVQGFDTLLFLQDLRAVIKTKTGANSEVNRTRVTLNNIKWDNITVNELIDFIYGKNDDVTDTFTFVELTGVINVVSDEWEDAEQTIHKKTISQPEYQKLIDRFGKEVFQKNNPLRITSGDAVYFNPTPETKKVILESYPEQVNQFNMMNDRGDVYQLIRGDEFEVMATIFTSEDKDYVYVISDLKNNGTWNSSKVVGEGSESFGTIGFTASYQKNTGNLRLVATEPDAFTTYDNKVVCVSIVENTPEKLNAMSSNIFNAEINVYLGIVNKVVPKENEISGTIDGANIRDNAYEIIDNEEHTLVFKFNDNVNASLNNLTVTFNNTAYQSNIEFSDYTYNSENNTVEIKFTGLMTENAVTSNTVAFNFEFDTNNESIKYVSKRINLKFNPKYADETNTKIYLGEQEISDILNIYKPGTYTFRIALGPDGYNVPIEEIEVDGSPAQTEMGHNYEEYFNVSDEVVDNTFTITIPNNFKNGEYVSFAIRKNIKISVVDKYDAHSFDINFKVQVMIIYPKIDTVYLGIQDYNGDATDLIVGERDANNKLSNKIFLLNGKGTTGDNKLIAGQDRINVVLKADKQKFTSDENQDGEFLDPTVKYTLEFTDLEHIQIEQVDESNIEAGEDVKVLGAVMSSEEEETSHGHDILQISIKPRPNEIGTIAIKGKYRLVYDVDDISSNNNDYNDTFDFEVQVNYTISSALTYKNLYQNEIYLVDDNSNFYTVGFDSNNQVNDESKALINKAIQRSVNFCGYGYMTTDVGGIKVGHFIGLYNNHKDWFMRVNGANGITSFYPSDRHVALSGVFDGTKTGINRNTNNTPVNKYESFDGMDDTTLWNQSMLLGQDPNNYYESNFYKIWNYFGEGENSTIKTSVIKSYIPTAFEIKSIFENKVILAKFNNLVSFLNEHAGLNYLTIDDLRRSIPEVKDQGNDNGRIRRNKNADDLSLYQDLIIVMNSNQWAESKTSDSSGYQVFTWVWNKISGSTNDLEVFNMSISDHIYYMNDPNNVAHREYLSILPFIQVS